MSAKFITFEGTEGVGKTTAIARLCERLRDTGTQVVQTREPGGSELAEKLRAMLIDPATQIDDATELLLMFTARSDHLHHTILPALNAGKWVVCDRFIDSSVAYQGYGRWQGDPDKLAKIDGLIDNFVPRLPDMTLWLDLPIAEGMARAGKRGEADRFEAEALAFFERVHQGFAKQQQRHPNRIHRIDASGTVEAVSERIWQAVQGLDS